MYLHWISISKDYKQDINPFCKTLVAKTNKQRPDFKKYKHQSKIYILTLKVISSKKKGFQLTVSSSKDPTITFKAKAKK